jgi:cytochrome b561
VARVLHWWLAAALVAQMTFGFAMDWLAPRNTPMRGFVVNTHKSIGVVLLVLLLLRLAWRLTHRPPPGPPTLSHAQRSLATWGHRVLYAVMIALPLAGLVASNLSRHGLRFFGIPVAPLGPDRPALYAFFNGTHDFLGWTLAIMVGLHAAIAVWHRSRRDGVFERMWP